MDKWFTQLEGKEVGKYTLDRYVGHGNIGYVYQGHPKETPDFKLAIKLAPGSPKDGWKNEIIKAQQLRGITGVVAFHDLDTASITHGRTKVFLYTVWDFITPGRNLRQYLEETPSCPASFLVAVLEQILRVLHACEKRGVKRHGDLHPGNILVGDIDEADLDASLEPREPIYVSDFGYGATGGQKTPKDDYEGLASIADAILDKIEWDQGTATDKQIITGVGELIRKLLRRLLNRREVLQKRF
jgi:serine/threonine protein kinase